MNTVYKQTQTGDMFAVTGGALGRHIGLNGDRYFELEPVVRLVDAQSRLPVKAPAPSASRRYTLLNDNLALTLTVSEAQLLEHFEKQPHLLGLQNSPTEDVLDQYRDELCNFEDLGWCAKVGLRSSHNMNDSLTRCVLHVLAKHVEALEAAKTPPAVAPELGEGPVP